MIIEELDRSQCKAVLSTVRFGHLGCCSNGQPYVLPIQFVAEGAYLYSFALTGQKIEWMRANPLVCVQVDEFGQNREWRSVIVNGRYEELPDRIGWKTERERAWSLLSQTANWWEPGGIKPVDQGTTPHLFYRIIIDEMTGRQAKAVS